MIQIHESVPPVDDDASKSARLAADLRRLFQQMRAAGRPAIPESPERKS